MSEMARADLARYRQKAFHAHTVVAVHFNRARGYLASADRNGEIAIWEGPRAKRIHSPRSTLTGVWFSDDGNWLIAGHQAGQLVIFDLDSGRVIADVSLKPGGSAPRMIGPRPLLDRVVHAACPLDKANFCVCLESGELVRMRCGDLVPETPIQLGRPLYDCASGSPDGRFVFLADDLGYIDRMDLVGTELRCFARHHEVVDVVDLSGRHSMADRATAVASLAASPDSNLVSSASRSGGVVIWETDCGPPQGSGADPYDRQPLTARTPVRGQWTRGLSFIPNSSELVIGDDSGVLESWDYESGRSSYLGRCSAGIYSLASYPDGGSVAVGCEDGGVYVVPLSGTARGGARGRLHPF